MQQAEIRDRVQLTNNQDEIKDLIIDRVYKVMEFRFKGRYYDRDDFLMRLISLDLDKFFSLMHNQVIKNTEDKVKAGIFISNELDVSIIETQKMFDENKIRFRNENNDKLSFDDDLYNGDAVYIVDYGVIIIEHMNKGILHEIDMKYK